MPANGRWGLIWRLMG